MSNNLHMFEFLEFFLLHLHIFGLFLLKVSGHKISIFFSSLKKMVEVMQTVHFCNSKDIHSNINQS